MGEGPAVSPNACTEVGVQSAASVKPVSIMRRRQKKYEKGKEKYLREIKKNEVK